VATVSILVFVDTVSKLFMWLLCPRCLCGYCVHCLMFKVLLCGYCPLVYLATVFKLFYVATLSIGYCGYV